MATRLEIILGGIMNGNRVLVCGFQTSVRKRDLMEFFDDKTNWGEEKVKTGRPWQMDELRLKSSEDIHKLWYVLLKERNMLMTMEHEYKREAELFPNPERLDKVEQSMENILEVIVERDEAYHMLEHGAPKQREAVKVRNVLGLKYFRKSRENRIPSYMNTSYKQLHPPYQKWKGKYLGLYFEKLRVERNKTERREKRQRRKLLEKFPHLTDEDLDAAFDNKIQ